jgi:flagellar hook-length control protein FliK
LAGSAAENGTKPEAPSAPLPAAPVETVAETAPAENEPPLVRKVGISAPSGPPAAVALKSNPGTGGAVDPAADPDAAAAKAPTAAKEGVSAPAETAAQPPAGDAKPQDRHQVSAEPRAAQIEAPNPLPPPDLPRTAPNGATPAQQQQLVAPAVAVSQLGVTIATRVKQGESRFQIRLDPPELGRIDVSLSVDKAGATNTVLTVERMDTLDLLQRDSRALERSLASAGFKSDPGSLQFNLRDPGQNPQGFAGQSHDGGQSRRFLFTAAVPAPEGQRTVPTPIAAGLYARSASRLGGLDIKV